MNDRDFILEIHRDVKNLLQRVAALETKMKVWSAISGFVSGLAASIVLHFIAK